MFLEEKIASRKSTFNRVGLVENDLEKINSNIWKNLTIKTLHYPSHNLHLTRVK